MGGGKYYNYRHCYDVKYYAATHTPATHTPAADFEGGDEKVYIEYISPTQDSDLKAGDDEEKIGNVALKIYQLT